MDQEEEGNVYEDDDQSDSIVAFVSRFGWILLLENLLLKLLKYLLPTHDSHRDPDLPPDICHACPLVYFGGVLSLFGIGHLNNAAHKYIYS